MRRRRPRSSASSSDWDGPPVPDAHRQAQIVESWTNDRLPVIAVSVESRTTLNPVLKEARARGTKILTWDSDGDVEARDFTVVHATPEAIGHALSFEVGRILSGHGSFAAITSTLSAPNQKVWLAEFKTRIAKDYPGIKLLDVVPCDDRSENARSETLRLLEKHPDIKAIVGFCSPAVPGAAEALKVAQAIGRPPDGCVASFPLSCSHRRGSRRQRRHLEDAQPRVSCGHECARAGDGRPRSGQRLPARRSAGNRPGAERRDPARPLPHRDPGKSRAVQLKLTHRRTRRSIEHEAGPVQARRLSLE